MYLYLLVFHSIFRWAVLASLVYSIYRAARGLRRNRAFSKLDNGVRHWTATIAHVQLALGLILYIKSPVIKYFWSDTADAVSEPAISFFGWYHILLMLISVVLITLGSALAKRRETDAAKYRTMLLWFSAGLLVIFIAIPWPFSPFANRPYLRTF
jgi:hypothetical protein